MAMSLNILQGIIKVYLVAKPAKNFSDVSYALSVFLNLMTLFHS